MILPIHTLVRSLMAEAVARLYGLATDDAALSGMAVEPAPRRALGDLAVPLAFELARRLRKAPRAIAQEIVDVARHRRRILADRSRTERLRQFLSRSAALDAPVADATRRVRSHPTAGRSSSTPRSIRTKRRTSDISGTRRSVTHSVGCCVFWDGRLRSRTTSTTPASRSQMLRSAFASSKIRRWTKSVRIADAGKFDYYCWDLYARVTEWYAGSPERLKIRAKALHDIERGNNDTAALASFIADRIVRAHLKTMRRMNIGYDLLTWEGDILRLHFWTHAFEFLKKTGAVFLQTEGKLKGCWVMRIDDEPATGHDDRVCRTEDEAEQREKVIVRSDGTVTYVGKDMAYQLWKFGLLGKDFYYRIFEEGPPPLWSTTSTPRIECDRSAIWTSLMGLQCHRHPPVVPAEAAQAGARRAWLHRTGGAFDSLFVRDGRTVPCDGARARLRHE